MFRSRIRPCYTFPRLAGMPVAGSMRTIQQFVKARGEGEPKRLPGLQPLSNADRESYFISAGS